MSQAISTTGVMRCWICGGIGTTGEHKTKRSDLKAIFGAPTQAAPLYFHDAKRKNRQIGSLDAKVLKSPSRLCANCNNARTQPHDRAWEKMSAALRSHVPPIAPGAVVRANRIFRYQTAREMLNVHLFFVKLFGCHILEGNIPIDLADFAAAILKERAHPRVYLKFGVDHSGSIRPTGMSDIWLANRSSDGACAYATWFYWLDGLGVNVMYAEDGERREGLLGAWHPRHGTNKLVLSGFQ